MSTQTLDNCRIVRTWPSIADDAHAREQPASLIVLVRNLPGLLCLHFLVPSRRLPSAPSPTAELNTTIHLRLSVWR